ncbi:uncharacterized protein LOC121374227 [Gigantopelta aegis]|uniref:uncharacterized protein LOC121374227 n=1 Tax=Gigantopelta aegis TaxID=1735272 RepID=UPI001B889C98|nr:uncharacterized protein LOC121374227 [Gigantopelta aegis]
MAHSSRLPIEDLDLGALENFSEFGLSCDSHKHHKFSIPDNECEIRLKATKDVKISAQLISCSDESKKLSDYVFTQRKGNTISFVISFPESGYYKFEIYALPSNYENKILPNVFNYLIIVDRATKVAHVFPKQYAQWQGVCYLYEPLFLDSSSGLQNIYFKVHIPNAAKAAIVVDGKDWHHLQLTGENFESTIALGHSRNKNLKLTLNANYVAGGTNYTTLLEYTIVNTQRSLSLVDDERNAMASGSWPGTEANYLGAHENFSRFGLSTDSHKKNKFSVPDNECEIRLKTTNDVKIISKLIDCSNQSKNLSDYVFKQKKGDTIFFLINFPKSGYYKFEIFALPSNHEKETLPNVFNYMIKVNRASKSAHVFPKQYTQFEDGGCYLYEPIVLSSSSGLRNVNFKVHIPNATKAAIVVDGMDWRHLELRGENFEGAFALDRYGNKDVKLALNANYGTSNTHYTTLLEYTIVNTQSSWSPVEKETNVMASGSWPPVEDHYLGALENFSRFGLSTDSPKQHKFSVPDNECEIRLKSTKDVKIITNLIDCSDQSKKLSDYVFTQKKGNTIFFMISFPKSGYYKFEIFALPSNYENETLPNVFNYMIKVNRASKSAHVFPKKYTQFEDGGCYLYEPIVLSSSSGLQNVNFKIHIPNATKAAIVVDGKDWRHLELRGENFEGAVALDRYGNKDVTVTLNATYGTSNTRYTTLLEYTIVNTQSSWSPVEEEKNVMASGSWPRVEDHYLGALENFSRFGLSTDSHKQQKFSIPDNECEIRLKSTKDVKITMQLIDCHDQSKNLSDYVFTQRKDNTIFFIINFPRSGYFQFEIYALPASDTSKTLLNVFNYLIKVDRATKAARAFPKLFAEWKNDCYLYEPIVLDSSCPLHNVNFKVHIPHAREAVVVVDGIHWNHLQLRGDNFEGTVALDRFRNKGVKVTLNANYGASNTYVTLLEYRI